jgi:uncharacterized protein (DUF433 family)
MNHARIVSNPAVMMGKPVVRGTRVTVESILRSLAAGRTIDFVIEQHDNLTRDDVLAALDFAASYVADEVVAAAE